MSIIAPVVRAPTRYHRRDRPLALAAQGANTALTDGAN